MLLVRQALNLLRREAAFGAKATGPSIGLHNIDGMCLCTMSGGAGHRPPGRADTLGVHGFGPSASAPEV